MKMVILLFHMACSGGHTAIVERLIQAGAGINSQGKMGYTALHMACTRGHTAIVERLIQEGADLNSQNNVRGDINNI